VDGEKSRASPRVGDVGTWTGDLEGLHREGVV